MFLSDNDKKITANRQIYLNKDGINELTGINCHKMENKHVLKRLKSLIPKKYHDYDVHELITKINQSVTKKNYSDYKYIQIGDTLEIKTRSRKRQNFIYGLDNLKLDYINQF